MAWNTHKKEGSAQVKSNNCTNDNNYKDLNNTS